VVSEWSWDTSVATVDFGSVTGIAAGSTGTTATVEYPLYVNWDGDCWAYGTNQTNVSGGVQVNPTVTVTSVSFDPTTIARHSAQSTITVQVSASTGVPTSTTVDVEVFQFTNPNGVSLDISPSTSAKTGELVTAGQVKSVTFVVSTPNVDSSAGFVTYKARITAVHVPNSSTVDIKPAGGDGVVSGQLCVGSLSNGQCQ
jgi:hypothetical protein